MPSVSQQDGLEVRRVSVQLKATEVGDPIGELGGLDEVERLEEAEEAEEATDEDLPPAMTPSIATPTEARGSMKIEMANRRIVNQQCSPRGQGWCVWVEIDLKSNGPADMVTTYHSGNAEERHWAFSSSTILDRSTWPRTREQYLAQNLRLMLGPCDKVPTRRIGIAARRIRIRSLEPLQKDQAEKCGNVGKRVPPFNVAIRAQAWQPLSVER